MPSPTLEEVQAQLNLERDLQGKRTEARNKQEQKLKKQLSSMRPVFDAGMVLGLKYKHEGKVSLVLVQQLVDAIEAFQKKERDGG